MFAFSFLGIFLKFGCASDPTPALPASIQLTESWLQSSRQIRYPITKTDTWEGWILHPDTTATGVILVHFETHPTFERWTECIRQQYTPNQIWLEQGDDTLTGAYLKTVAPTLPVQKVSC